MDNYESRHGSSRSFRDALSKKCQRIHKTRKIRSEFIRKELEISGIQDKRAKYKLTNQTP